MGHCVAMFPSIHFADVGIFDGIGAMNEAIRYHFPGLDSVVVILREQRHLKTGIGNSRKTENKRDFF